MQQPKSNAGLSRRTMLRGAAAASAATFAALGSNYAWAQASDELRVGVIGAGGRASGAVADHVKAAEIVGVKSKVVAVCDMFPNKSKGLADKYKVPADKTFNGLDGYKQVAASDCHIIITATPPGFRPLHFAAAIEAGKHVFFEKPVATCPWGVRVVMAAAKLATEKRLSVVAGTQRRHETNYIDTVKRIHDGLIGDILHMSVYWCGGGIWSRKREPGMTDIEYQIHNWYHHIWLSGDQICEQHIHNLDVANWVMGSHPISAFGSGGRQCRKEAGEIWDNTNVEYEYPNGGRVISFGRHWPGDSNVSEFAIGTKGTSSPGGWIQVKGGEKITAKNQRSGYVQEHIDLLTAIKEGKPINEGQQVAESTLTAIMGRMSCYSGRKLSWDYCLNDSNLRLIPENLTKDTPAPAVDVPVPGNKQNIHVNLDPDPSKAKPKPKK